MGLLRRVLDTTGLFPLAERVYLWTVATNRKITVAFTLPLLANVPFLRRIWFGLFSGVFSHEMEMFVKARLVYYRRAQSPLGNLSLLRRNIHRIEKGLLMENRKPLFALDYIGETVSEFIKTKEYNPQSSILDWADDVLNAYFECVANHPVADASRLLFVANRCKDNGCSLEFVPYKSQPFTEAQQANVADVFSLLMYHRKSVRIFEKNNIPPRGLIDTAVTLAAQAPSSCNRQPFEFRLFDHPEMVAYLSSLAGGTKGFSAGIPMLCVVVGKMDASPSPGDRHLMYVDGSLASMSLMLALESLGLSSCPINWPDNPDNETKLRRKVSLAPFERPIMLIAIGYAASEGLVAYSKRKNLDELRKYN